VSYTTKALDSGTTYYFRVRAYKTVSGTDYNGANSAVKSKKTSGKAATAKKGDIIKFGKYDWRVLDVKDGKALIITDKVIGARSDNSGVYGGGWHWENSILREYLNDGFYNSFGKKDRTRIIKTKVSNKVIPWYNESDRNDTEDYIFLLSLDEVVKYFGDSGQLLNGNPNSEFGISDEYNKARIAYTLNGSTSDWWLRTGGYYHGEAAHVQDDGIVDTLGYYLFGYHGVRPAMWITL
jgi:hypothetical protein